MLRASEGERNDTLFRVAARAFELVKSGEAEGQSATDGLRRAAIAAGLGEAEVEATLASAWRTAEPKTGARRAIDPRVDKYDLMGMGDLKRLPAPKWLIPDVLPEGLSLLIGRYGSLKSWLALDWSAAVSERGMRAVFCVGEDVHGFAQRVVDLGQARGVDLENLRIMSDVPKLMRPGEPERLSATLAEFEADLLVIDTWALALPGVGENEFEKVSLAVDVLKGLMSEHRCSSLVVAHTNYQDARMRGHTSVEDASDCIWHARRDQTLQGSATVENRKIKNSPLLPTLDVSLIDRGGHVVLEPSALDDMGE